MSFTVGPGESRREWNVLATRTPIRFRDRVLSLFRSPRNLAYLRGYLAKRAPVGRQRTHCLNALEDSVLAFEPGVDLVESDPLAQRGANRSATGVWAEVRRLNVAFVTYQLDFLRDYAALLSGHTADGPRDDDEPYHYRAFVADSLRPPGLERLNGNGPLFGIHEDQTIDEPAVVGASGRREGMTSDRKGLAMARRSTAAAPAAEPGVDPDDLGWDAGDPNRTAEQAIAQYWGPGQVETSVLGESEVGGEAYIQRYGQGPQWRENNGSRFMRYPTIPIWQNLSRGREYERDIEETLGTGGREFDNHVRRWNVDRMRKARGEEYRRYGPRSGK